MDDQIESHAKTIPQFKALCEQKNQEMLLRCQEDEEKIKDSSRIKQMKES